MLQDVVLNTGRVWFPGKATGAVLVPVAALIRASMGVRQCGDRSMPMCVPPSIRWAGLWAVGCGLWRRATGQEAKTAALSAAQSCVAELSSVSLL